MASQPIPERRPQRILMLHGLFQSGPLFQAKTSALEKALTKTFPGVQLIYPTAPIPVHADDQPARADGRWSWWQAAEPRGEYHKLDETLAFLADLLHREGPVDGIIGFSQGAALGMILAALLEPGRREALAEANKSGETASSFLPDDSLLELKHPQLKFMVAYSGFSSEHETYAAIYSPPIATPSMHYIGSLDEFVTEEWTEDLVAKCQAGSAVVMRHPSAHVVPSSKRDIAVVVDFVRRSCEA